MAFTGISIKSFTRVAAVALALGASSLVAAPAFAQGAPGFSIEMHSNGGQGFDNNRGRDRNHGWDDNSRQRCLSEREAIRGVSAYGYRQIDITRQRGDRLELEAVKGNWAYSMRVDLCSGQVDRLQRIGRAFGSDNHGWDDRDGGRGRDSRGDTYNGFDGGGNDGGFGFQFNFGN